MRAPEPPTGLTGFATLARNSATASPRSPSWTLGSRSRRLRPASPSARRVHAAVVNAVLVRHISMICCHVYCCRIWLHHQGRLVEDQQVDAAGLQQRQRGPGALAGREPTTALVTWSALSPNLASRVRTSAGVRSGRAASKASPSGRSSRSPCGPGRSRRPRRRRPATRARRRARPARAAGAAGWTCRRRWAR